MSVDDTEATFNLYCPPARPDRATAVREVEALLRRVHDVTDTVDDVEFYVAGDGVETHDAANVTAAELASLVVDAVLGAEQDGPDRSAPTCRCPTRPAPLVALRGTLREVRR